MKLIFLINKLFILLLLSIGIIVSSYAMTPLDGWSDNELCEWMDQPSPPWIIQNLVDSRKISCSNGIAKRLTASEIQVEKKVEQANLEGRLKSIEASNAFDGNYTFKLFSYGEVWGYMMKTHMGGGFFEINNGVITIAAKNRTRINKFSGVMVEASADNKYFNSFDGRVDKSGTIVANFLYNPCSEGDCGGAKNFPVSGSIEGLELTGKFILGNGPDFNEIIFELEAN